MPYVGTEKDDHLLRSVCKIVHANKAQLLVVHVLEVPMALSLDTQDLPGTDSANQLLSRAEGICSENGINVSTMLLRGRDAGTAIVNAATKQNSDLIVLEAWGNADPGAQALGKTTGYVTRQAKCPVWINRTANAK